MHMVVSQDDGFWTICRDIFHRYQVEGVVSTSLHVSGHKFQFSPGLFLAGT